MKIRGFLFSTDYQYSLLFFEFCLMCHWYNVTMLSNSDINRIITACDARFVTKEEFQEFKDEMRANFAAIISILDGMSKQIAEMKQEITMIKVQLARHERWHHQIAEHLDIKLEY